MQRYLFMPFTFIILYRDQKNKKKRESSPTGFEPAHPKVLPSLYSDNSRATD